MNVAVGSVGFGTTIVVPSLSPSASWFATESYVEPVRVRLNTTNVTDAAEPGACDPRTEQVPSATVTHDVSPDEPPL